MYFFNSEKNLVSALRVSCRTSMTDIHSAIIQLCFFALFKFWVTRVAVRNEMSTLWKSIIRTVNEIVRHLIYPALWRSPQTSVRCGFVLRFVIPRFDITRHVFLIVLIDVDAPAHTESPTWRTTSCNSLRNCRSLVAIFSLLFVFPGAIAVLDARAE